MTTPVAFDCPRYLCAADYIHDVRWAVRNGREIWPPATRAELEALIEEFPAIGRRYLPDAETLLRMGLPEHFGREVDRWSDLEQDRFLLTVQEDDQFREALKTLLGVL